jgi:hypothetical protein
LVRIPGRAERIEEGQPFVVVVDYAHTPDSLKALYDASSGGKEQFSYIDVGLNPDAKLPTNTGRIVWMAPGGMTIGMGDNTGWGGTNVSSFGLAGSVDAATLSVDGKALIENGTLK